MKVIEQLKQIANNLGGVDAGELLSKDDKKTLYDLGLVWPAYGSTFRLTPAGKQFCLANNIPIAPFSVTPKDELRKLCDRYVDSEWDRERIDEWFTLATNS